jgi:YfiH family protein
MLIEAPELSSFPNVRHAFFTRQGGVSEGIYASLNGGFGSKDDPAHVQENRARMAEQIGTDAEHLLSLHQIHSATVVTVTEPWSRAERPRADGMVTATPHLALGILTADCGPVLFADHATGVIGACHAGWGGAIGGVLEATIDAMVALGAEREAIVAVLGPTIGPTAYEVGPEFEERFLKAGPDNSRFFVPAERAGHAMFDLPAYIVARLEAAGIGEVADVGLCTYSDEERFFSYRRTTHRGEPDYGRQVSAITLTR